MDWIQIGTLSKFHSCHIDTIKILRCHRTKRNDMQSSSFQTTVEANLDMTVSVPSNNYLKSWFQYIQIFKNGLRTATYIIYFRIKDLKIIH